MSPDQPVGPAVLLNSFGKGQVLTFAASPDFATASEHPIVEARKLLRNAISMMRPEPRLRIAAPATVECVVTDDPNHRKLRVHFIAYNPTPQTTAPKNRPYAIPGLIEDVPIFRTSIQVSGHFSNVTAVNPDTKLSTEGQTVNAQIEDIHEVIVIDY